MTATQPLRPATRGLRLAVAAVTCLTVSLGLAQTKSKDAKSGRPQPATVAAPTPPPVDYAPRFAQTCAACHGADGRGVPNLGPVLAGQPSFYAITQLFLFRAGRRGNEAMSAIAKNFTDDDLRGYSDLIGKLPALPTATTAPSTEPVDAARLAQGRLLAQKHHCLSCHGETLTGGPQIPRLAGQQQDYLARALKEFRAGTRLGYTSAMNEALAGLKPEELDTLAYYLARHTGTAQ